jgi:hypothetical protein
MNPSGQLPTKPDPEQAVERDKGVVLQAAPKYALIFTTFARSGLLRHVFGTAGFDIGVARPTFCMPCSPISPERSDGVERKASHLGE